MSRSLIPFFLLSLLFFACNTQEETATESPSKPNVIVILADDLGYGDIGVMNPDCQIPTPNIDRLGQNGVVFTDAHTTSSVCTPTRYSILTGRYNWRSTLKAGVNWTHSPALIDNSLLTIGDMFRQNGYSSAAIGKWHLGWDWTYHPGSEDSIDFTSPVRNGPLSRGFDYFYGIKSSLDIPPYVYVENDRITALPDRTTADPVSFWREGQTGSDFEHDQVLPKLKDKAVEFITTHADSTSPFFLYFPLTAPHTPILPTEQFRGTTGLNEYGDFVHMVDWVVGEVVAALDQTGQRENTLVIFTSDNGCSPYANFKELEEKGHDPSYVYRGHKADIYEGGHRVPFIVNWPAKLQGSNRSDALISTVDLVATFGELLNVDFDPDQAVDSYSFLRNVTGKGESDRRSLVHHSVNGSFALRKGDWKLIMAPGSGGWSYPSPRDNPEILATLPPVQLYNMAEDVDEQQNLYAEYPALVDSLKRELIVIIMNGRSTPGPELPNDAVETWPQISWMTDTP